MLSSYFRVSSARSAEIFVKIMHFLEKKEKKSPSFRHFSRACDQKQIILFFCLTLIRNMFHEICKFQLNFTPPYNDPSHDTLWQFYIKRAFWQAFYAIDKEMRLFDCMWSQWCIISIIYLISIFTRCTKKWRILINLLSGHFINVHFMEGGVISKHNEYCNKDSFTKYDLGKKKSSFSVTFSENEEGRGDFFFFMFFYFRNLWKVPHFYKKNRT